MSHGSTKARRRGRAAVRAAGSAARALLAAALAGGLSRPCPSAPGGTSRRSPASRPRLLRLLRRAARRSLAAATASRRPARSPCAPSRRRAVRKRAEQRAQRAARPHHTTRHGAHEGLNRRNRWSHSVVEQFLVVSQTAPGSTLWHRDAGDVRLLGLAATAAAHAGVPLTPGDVAVRPGSCGLQHCPERGDLASTRTAAARARAHRFPEHGLTGFRGRRRRRGAGRYTETIPAVNVSARAVPCATRRARCAGGDRRHAQLRGAGRGPRHRRDLADDAGTSSTCTTPTSCSTRTARP